MSLAPSIAVPRPAFNPLPLYIGLFCLLWSFAFVAGKIGVTDCPPLLLLTARFSLAGILILGISALRGEGWQLSWRGFFLFAPFGGAQKTLFFRLWFYRPPKPSSRPRRARRPRPPRFSAPAGPRL